MTPKKNVLVLSSWYPSRINPTLGNFNEKFAEAAALYNNVTALHVCADAEMTTAYEIIEFEKDNVNTILIYFRKKKNEHLVNKISKALRYFKYYVKGYTYILKKFGKPHIVHLNILYPVGIIAYFFRIFYKLPYVISENWTGYLPSNKVQQGFLKRLISKRIACSASALLPVTENLKKALQAEGFKNTYYIVPNVTDVQYFYPNISRNVPEKKVMLHISHLLDEHKNISGLLRVTKRLSLERSDFELHLVSDGDIKPHLKNINELKLDGIVHFFETMSPQEVAEKMRQSDFFVLFSNYENLPCVMVEAMASGLPVVSTTAGGVAEHLSEDKGILLEPKDEETLYLACNTMLDTVGKYDKENLHAYALSKFSYKSVGHLLTDIYLDIIEKRLRK